MKRCAICGDGSGTFAAGKWGDPDTDEVCKHCRRWNETNGVDWNPPSRRTRHSDRLDERDFPARLADVIPDDAPPKLNETQRTIVRLLATGKSEVTRKVRRRVNGRRAYVPVRVVRAMTVREIAAQAGVTISYVAKFSALFKGAR